MERKHAELWDAEKAKKERAAPQPAAGNALGFKPLPKPSAEEKTVRAATIYFSQTQCVRLLVAALVLTHRAVNTLADPFFRLALLAISGSTFRTYLRAGTTQTLHKCATARRLG
jgi:hypothetical protein